MDAKHTPGLWQYGVREDGSMWLSIGDPKSGPHYQGDLVASRADADLIVAAPDLLAALVEIQRIAAGTPAVERNPRFAEARRAALAAIAKAKGEA